ncbi:MAG: hypothetical protein IMZ58_11420 [Thermoplasmata archaeon]|nr:hypothetical protein [Thermoplasmata archaeon]
MKNKLAGILICVMMLVTILPITALATTISSEPQTTAGGLLDRTTVRGFVLFKRTSDGGKTAHFFAIRLHYSTISVSGERSSGIIRMEPIEIPSAINGYLGHLYVFGSFRGWFNP